MCLITKQKEPIILTEDLKGFKVLRDQAAPVTEFYYNLKQLYETEISTDHSNKYAAADKIAANYLNTHYPLWYEGGEDLMAVSEGFHFITSLERAEKYSRSYYDSTIHECTIPAGSEVYYDETDLAVANQIIIH